MQTINDILDMAKKKQNLTSDNQLRIKLGSGNIPKYRKGYEVPKDKTAIMLAELSGMKPELVIAICHAAKAETKEEKSIWNHFYKMAAAAAVTGFMVSGGVSVVGNDTDKAQNVSLSQIENGESNAMDIM